MNLSRMLSVLSLMSLLVGAHDGWRGHLQAASKDGRVSSAREEQALTSSSSWLDAPLKAWNSAGNGLPKAPRVEEPREQLMKRCDLKLLGSTAGERALAESGWLPFRHVDQQLLRDDVEVIGGMTAADGMCRPAGFNLFVFVGGTFAGTLSPGLMTSRLDSSIGAVRIASADLITADFVRYSSTDPLCCPSSHVAVRYKINRTGSRALVEAAERRVRQ